MWKDLTMQQRADLMDIFLEKGVHSLSDIQRMYNEFAGGGHLYGGEDEPTQQMNNNKNGWLQEYVNSTISSAVNNVRNTVKQSKKKPVTTGGAGYVPSVSPNFINDAIYNISRHLMNYGRNYSPSKGITLNGREPVESMAQATYLTPRNIQKRKFLEAGYTEAPKDYGLVKKAVGNRNIPVYQKRPDDEKRENLIAIGNVNTEWFGNDKAELVHAGSYPTAIYINPENSKIYQKAWDLNDYGGTTGSAKYYNPIKSLKANIIDKVGSPVVVTSGISEVENRNIKGALESVLDDFMYNKGLIKYRDTIEEKIPLNSAHGEPMYNLNGSRVYMTDKKPFTYYGLPEVTVYGKKKKK